MSSSKFSRRPRIQPLPPVCKKSPETTSCYDRPIEPPEPLTVDGTLEILALAGGRLYYSTFRASGHRNNDYHWDFSTTDSEGNWCNPELVWERPDGHATFTISFIIPIHSGQTFEWPGFTLIPDFPWFRSFQQTLTDANIQICTAQFFN